MIGFGLFKSRLEAAELGILLIPETASSSLVTKLCVVRVPKKLSAASVWAVNEALGVIREVDVVRFKRLFDTFVWLLLALQSSWNDPDKSLSQSDDPPWEL